MAKDDDNMFTVPKAFRSDAGRYYDTQGKKPNEKKYARLMADLASLAIPGGIIAKGVFKFGRLTGPKAVEAARKAIIKAKEAKAKKAIKPNSVTTTKPKPKPQSEAARVQQKPKVMPKPGKAVTRVKPSAAAAKRMPKPGMKKATVTSSKTRAKPELKKPATSKPVASSTSSNLKKAAVVAAGVGLADKIIRDGKPADAASRNKRGGGGPSTRGGIRGTNLKPGSGGPATRGGKRGTKKTVVKPNNKAVRTSISASKNTGFGPKGNIFPSNAAERAALMKMYGGTGSAAAKAAAAGTQGNIKAGKAALAAAKKARLQKGK